MKYIIFFLLLSLTAAGQQEFFHAQNKGLLLDEYPNAAAAYSLRRVNSRYTGALIRVRRDSTGQAEQDIGSIGEALDTVALKAFIRNNSGYVTRWYDQSGNARNATQTTAANQPRIVNAGVVDRRNGKPALRFYNAGQSLSSYKFAAPSTNWCFFDCVSYDNVSGNNVYYGIDGGGFQVNGIYTILSTVIYNRAGNYTFSAPPGTLTNNVLLLLGTQYLSDNSGISFFNSNTSTSKSLLISGLPFTIGSRSDFLLGQYPPFSAANSLIGNIAEHIVYQQDLSTNINVIKTNINSYYAIY